MTAMQQLAGYFKTAVQRLGIARAAQIQAEASQLKSTQEKVDYVAKQIGERSTRQRAAIQPATAQPSTEAADLRKQLAAANARVADLEAEVKRVGDNLEIQASRRALEITGSQGNIPPASTRVSGNPGGGGKEALWAEYHRLPIAERNEFYAKHRNAMRSR